MGGEPSDRTTGAASSLEAMTPRPAPARPTRMRGEARRRRLLQEAIKLFSTRGYERTTRFITFVRLQTAGGS